MPESIKVIAIHFGVMIPLQFLAVTAGLLRLYTRIYITKLGMGIEEWCVGAAITLSGACALAIAVSDLHFGEGTGLGTSPEEIRMKTSLYKTQWGSSIIYALENFLIKTSILLLYRRIFTIPLFENLCTALLYFNAAASLANIFAFAFICQPVQHFWQQVTPNPPPGKCLSFRTVWISFGSINVLTDFAAVLLPLPVLRNLHAQKRKRQFLMSIFALSSIPCIASIIRMYSLRHITPHNLPSVIWQHDLWCGVEMTLGTTCACLPTLTPLAARHFPRALEGAGVSAWRTRRRVQERRSYARVDAKEFAGGGPTRGESASGGTSTTATSTVARKLGLKGEGKRRVSRHYWWWGAHSLLNSEGGGQSLATTMDAGRRAGAGGDAVMLRDLPPVVDVEIGSGRGSLRMDYLSPELRRQSRGAVPAAGGMPSKAAREQQPMTTKAFARSESTMVASSSTVESGREERSWLE